ncbi:Hypp4201 [Branchiostoma lanceolatum]|uniref:Hypp4201 protein n=1 Tax=Branchiostoma lanceolatum TaxID=7740 RepID=A0A8K0AB28_BRALA|nr:Hypp4201 [Branchiostoma lanceolatum]
MATGSGESKTRSKKLFYIRDSVVDVEEDFNHEFKGHRNLAVEELPSWCYQPGSERRSRRAISRALNAFLNTGKGGTVYLGITDDGRVKGIRLTQYQKDHVVTGMVDLMGRYNPPVARHRWKIKFVPVVTLRDEIEAGKAADVREGLDEDTRQRPHLLRTPDYCWCDKDALAQFNRVFVAPDYVVEITVLPFDASNSENKAAHPGGVVLYPIHEDEEGHAYFRRQACIYAYTMQEIKELTVQQVREHYQPTVDSLRERLYALRSQGLHQKYRSPDQM